MLQETVQDITQSQQGIKMQIFGINDKNQIILENYRYIIKMMCI